MFPHWGSAGWDTTGRWLRTNGGRVTIHSPDTPVDQIVKINHPQWALWGAMTPI
ncbi:MAG: hypothetical protein CM1200mP10_08880 [Candidatus Neomarinimicrobiota bacterium]|nr:MAG: hypothetical protein CM1200mP10_08880 [Candidatus Neomarinimicrobiota bacterium]